jgi:protein-tyrosine phosphatase
MAEALLRHRLAQLGIVADIHSAGLLDAGVPASPPAVDVLGERGIDLSSHRSRRMARELIDRADLVLCMERRHVREAVLLDPSAFARIFTLKELVRRGEAMGPRGPEESLQEWLARANLGRRVADHLGASADDDVDDPIGRSREFYARTMAELESLISRLVGLLFAWVAAA